MGRTSSLTKLQMQKGDAWPVRQKTDTGLARAAKLSLEFWGDTCGSQIRDTVLAITPLNYYLHRLEAKYSDLPIWVLGHYICLNRQKEKISKWKSSGHLQQLTSSDLSTQSWSPSQTHSIAMQRPSPQRCSFVGLQSGGNKNSGGCREPARQRLRAEWLMIPAEESLFQLFRYLQCFLYGGSGTIKMPPPTQACDPLATITVG